MSKQNGINLFNIVFFPYYSIGLLIKVWNARTNRWYSIARHLPLLRISNGIFFPLNLAHLSADFHLAW